MGNFRTEDEEGALDAMSLDEYLVENKEATFMLRAGTSALSDRGILLGDLLIVDRSRVPRQNDIVIGVENGEFVLRRLADLGGASVEAVVTAVIRKY